MAGKTHIKLIHVLGWILVIISSCMVIAGLIANDGDSTGIGVIVFFAIVDIFGFFMTRYKRTKQATLLPYQAAQETKEFPEDRAYRETMAGYKPEKPPSSGQYDRPSNEKQVDYRPLLDLCTEIENNADNNYLPFDTPISVEVVYSDSDEETTMRAVDVRYIAKSDYGEGYYIKAYCHLRNEDRAFKVERIQKTIVDQKTVDFVQYLVDTYRKTDKYKEAVLSVKTRKLLNSNDTMGHTAIILTYIARIGGTFTRKGKTIIAALLKELDNNQNADIEIENYIAELAELKPTTAEYKNTVKIAEISKPLIEKAKEIAGKDPLRQGAFEILNRQFEKSKN